jgi:hypothetical protein
MAGGIFGRLRAMFTSPERTLYVEEDSWGQVEVLPVANADWCRAEFARIAAFADAHQAPGGAGWTDIYIRKPAAASLADLRMPLVPTLEALGLRLPAFDRVTSGSFYDPEPVANAWGFGPSPKTALIVIGDKNKSIVKSIPVIANEDDGAARLMVALESLPSSGGLMVVDWVRGELTAVRP